MSRYFKVAIVNLSILAALLLMVEGCVYLLFYANSGDETIVKFAGSRKNECIVEDEILGWKLKADCVSSGHKVVVDRKTGEQIEDVYNVRYTTDRFGFRHTGAIADPGRARACVFFYGGSVTFGEGLNDQQSLPFQFGAQNEDLRTVNVGISGYGPHQTYLITQREDFFEQFGCGRVFASVFSFIPGHILRVNGALDWAKKGPWLALEKNEILLKGRLWERPSASAAQTPMTRDILRLAGSFLGSLRKHSYLADFLFENISPHLQITTGVSDADIDLTYRLIKGTLEAGPGDGIHRKVVIYWNFESSDASDRVVSRLRGDGMKILPVKSILHDKAAYQVHPEDGHPNEVANRLIAEQLKQAIADD